MKRIPILIIPVLLCWLPFGFAQTPPVVAEKQDPLKDSIDKYFSMEQYEKSYSFAQQLVEKVKKEKGEGSLEFGVALNLLGNSMMWTGRTKEAEPLLIQSLEIKKQKLGYYHPEIANSYYSLGILEGQKNDVVKAESYLLTALEIRKKVLLENHISLYESNFWLGRLFFLTFRYIKAEQYWSKGLDIQINRCGYSNNEEVTKALLNLNHSFKEINQPNKVDSTCRYHVSKVLSEKKMTPLELGSFFESIGGFYFEVAKYKISDEYYYKALDFYSKAIPEKHSAMATINQKIGLNYLRSGDFTKTQYYVTKSISIRNSIHDTATYQMAVDMLLLGCSERFLGNINKARPLFEGSYKIARKFYSDSDVEMNTFFEGLTATYLDFNEFSKANEYALMALRIFEKNVKLNSLIGHQNGVLAQINLNAGNFFKSKQYLEKSLHILKDKDAYWKNEFAGSKLFLGNILLVQNKLSKAEIELKDALNIFEKINQSDHPTIGTGYSSLGMLFLNQEKLKLAEEYFRKSERFFTDRVVKLFPGLSTDEKQKLLETFQEIFETYNSFGTKRYLSNPEISGFLYNNQLNTKSLLLSNAAKWKHRIKSSGDKKLFLLFTEWEAKQNELASWSQSKDLTNRPSIDSVKDKVEKLEKELSSRSENFSKLADRKIFTWKDIQKTLKPGEAPIEMIRVRKFGIAKTVTDTSDPKKPIYKIKGLTDTIQYAALVVKPTSLYPEMVLLKNGNDLEVKYLHFYTNNIKYKRTDEQSYNQFWKKIGDQLKDVKTVYFSPDGVYNSINLNTLRNPKTGKYLLEEKEIRLVTVTKDLVTPKQEEEPNKLACLVGYPNYYKMQVGVKTTRSSPQLDYSLDLESSKTLVELPATKIEVEKIGNILSGKGWEVQTYTEDKALEENIKDSYKPKVLHVATHGYFHADSSKGKNPLLNSGLMLTGGGSTLKGEKSETAEDGILTAYEAMNLNLDNTDLVVLSACETGIGEIKNGEGVYGLQRAFKVAGAKTIIMSLWEVADGPTQELMVGFYRNWLSAPQLPGSSKLPGSLKRQAFLKAQKELKVKYPDPYYWGAFVMVGE